MDEEGQDEGNRGRWIAAIAAIVLAIVVVAVILLRSGSGYEVKARFINASQLVKGNLVEVGGVSAGKVTAISLTDDGQAQVTLKIDGDYAPLRRGTIAAVRQTSLSGIANRYVDLLMGPGTGPTVPDGGTIDTQQTESAVDLDQVFHTLGPRTRAALKRDIQGFADTNAGRVQEANDAFRYLNPALSASSRLFSELDRNTPYFERFIVETSHLVTDAASRGNDLSGLVSNLATTSTAIASERPALSDAIARLPEFMRKANTTFVNLRSTLDDLTPLVDSSKPVVHKLRPLMAQLRPLAQDAVPTVRDLSSTIRRPGASNDLVELVRAQPPVAHIALGPVDANGASREGAFPASIKALNGATPELAFGRPYAVDLTGWFDDFSNSGDYDALGSFSRAGLALSAFTVTPTTGELVPVPPELRQQVLAAGAKLYRNNRCPGSDERDPGDHSTAWRPSPDFNCDPSMTPVGP